MTPQALQTLIAKGEYTRHHSDIHQLRYGVSRLRNPLFIRVLTALQNGGPLSKAQIAEALGLHNVTGQLNAQVRALLNRGHIEMTLPEKPNSRLQQYRLTQVGMQKCWRLHPSPPHDHAPATYSPLWSPRLKYMPNVPLALEIQAQ